jgi:hypothetical protein
MSSLHLSECAAALLALSTFKLPYGLGRQPIFKRREQELVPVRVRRFEALQELDGRSVGGDARHRIRGAHDWLMNRLTIRSAPDRGRLGTRPRDGGWTLEPKQSLTVDATAARSPTSLPSARVPAARDEALWREAETAGRRTWDVRKQPKLYYGPAGNAPSDARGSIGVSPAERRGMVRLPRARGPRFPPADSGPDGGRTVEAPADGGRTRPRPLRGGPTASVSDGVDEAAQRIVDRPSEARR